MKAVRVLLWIAACALLCVLGWGGCIWLLRWLFGFTWTESAVLTVLADVILQRIGATAVQAGWVA